MSCKTCQTPSLLPAFGEHADKLKSIPNVVDELMPLLDLHKTAEEGCDRCCIILDLINHWHNVRGDFHHVDHPEQYYIGIAPTPQPGTKAARTGALGLAIAVTRKEGWEHWNYLSWSRNDHLWDFDAKFELYTESKATSLAYQIPLLESVSLSPNPDACAGPAKRWLEYCLSHHVNCPSNTKSELPTRVIHVGDTGTSPKLVQSRPGQSEMYCALSYCWGQSRAFTTTQATYADRLDGFSLLDLPGTIRDAVLLARALGIQYLWVDSLCIIQDSASDWAYEAARMCEVYTNAAITFAAVDSPASETGLLVAGSDRRRVSLDRGEMKVYARTHRHSGLDDPRATQYDGSKSGVLHTRGWCLQEIALSSRVLWMKSSEINWSCIQCSACECDPQLTDTLHRSNILSLAFALRGVRYYEKLRAHPSQWMGVWKDLVTEYTGRRLTHISDRLPAIAGLATLVQRHLNVRYLFGLWESSDLLDQLLWSSLQHADEVRWLEYVSGAGEQLAADLAPSWSWASSSAHVSIPFGGFEGLDPSKVEGKTLSSEQQSGGPKTRVWSIQNIAINMNTSNLFGTGTGTITLQSLLVPVTVYDHSVRAQTVLSLIHHSAAPSNEDGPLVLLRQFDWLQTCDIEDEDRSYVFDAWRKDSRVNYKDEHVWYQGRTLFFIFANVEQCQMGRARKFNGLLLERLYENSSQSANIVHRRLGYGEGVFLTATGSGPTIQRETDHIPTLIVKQPTFTRATWEYWKILGTWTSIDIA